MHKSFAYSGRKLKFLDTINEALFDHKTDILVEPFCGSGVVSLNAPQSMKFMNDIDSNVMLIHRAFKYGSYDQFASFIAKHYELADLTNKLYYYAFREWYNLNLHNTTTNLIDKGFALYFLAGACINSMLRFGKSGMNQGCGNRDNSARLTESEFEALHNAYQSIELFSDDWLSFVNYLGSMKSTSYFVDPPYFGSGHVYANNVTKLRSKLDLLGHIKALPGAVLYTDKYSDTDAIFLQWHITELRLQGSSAPFASNDRLIDKTIEVMYNSNTINIIQ
jgi:site-specific DNA-adenine methylase